MQLNDLKICLLLDEERHFGRVAVRARLTQPAVSQALKRVERHYGVRLFDRTSRDVEPTRVGEQLLPHIRSAIDRVEAIALTVRSLPRRAGRLISIGHTAWSRPDAHELTRTLHRQAPEVDVLLKAAPAARLVECLRDGVVDVVCTGIPPSEPALHVVSLPRTPLRWLAVPQPPSQMPRSLVVPEGTRMDPAVLQRLRTIRELGITAESDIGPVDGPDAAVDAVVTARAVALLAPEQVPDSARPLLRFVRLETELAGPGRHLVAAVDSGQPLHRAMAALVDCDRAIPGAYRAPLEHDRPPTMVQPRESTLTADR